jgi:hypothetical protein
VELSLHSPTRLQTTVHRNLPVILFFHILFSLTVLQCVQHRLTTNLFAAVSPLAVSLIYALNCTLLRHMELLSVRDMTDDQVHRIHARQ